MASSPRSATPPLPPVVFGIVGSARRNRPEDERRLLAELRIRLSRPRGDYLVVLEPVTVGAPWFAEKFADREGIAILTYAPDDALALALAADHLLVCVEGDPFQHPAVLAFLECGERGTQMNHLHAI